MKEIMRMEVQTSPQQGGNEDAGRQLLVDGRRCWTEEDRLSVQMAEEVETVVLAEMEPSCGFWRETVTSLSWGVNFN